MIVGMVDDRAMRFRQPVAPPPPRPGALTAMRGSVSAPKPSTPVDGALRNPAMVDRNMPSNARLGAITRQLKPGPTPLFGQRVPKPKFIETNKKNVFGKNQMMPIDSKIFSFRDQPMPAPPLRDADSWQMLSSAYPYGKIDPVTREVSDAYKYRNVETDEWGRLIQGEGFRDDMDARVQAIVNKLEANQPPPKLVPYRPTEEELRKFLEENKHRRSTLYN